MADAERATALGHLANANGVRSVAVGEAAEASGDGAVAMGNQAVASGTNSVAIGNGATATNDGQVVIAGLDTSTASQMGPLSFVTADTNGTLGTTSVDMAGLARQADVAANTMSIMNNANAIEALRMDFDGMATMIDENREGIRNANAGVALALSMESPNLPSGANFGLAGGVGYFDEQVAASVAFAARTGNISSVNAGLGVTGRDGKVGARAGFQLAW